ncbi:MAG: hypothetical protein IJK18_03485 [Clostridia bacterium]|nr:hypothetical protein [Clostridia bacterium]
MEEEKKKAYSEVVEILKLIDNEEKIEKIPFEVIELIKNNSEPSYKPTIDKDKPLEEQNLRDETYSILAWIANKYWNENIAIEPNNSEQIQTETKLNPKASVYNDIEPEILERCDQLGPLPILKSDLKWFVRIKQQVLKLLKILFRVKNAEKEIN